LRLGPMKIPAINSPREARGGFARLISA
jgi:hypothetical protein